MSRPQILIVEDNPTTRKMFRVAVQAEGLTAVEAGDGAAAIAQMTSAPAQLVLLDMVLPDMDGLELARRLRALPHGAAVPLVAMSGFQRLLDDAKQLPDLFEGFLFKPVDLTALGELLRKHLPAAEGVVPDSGVALGRRVLLVDDDPVQLKLMALRLGTHVGHVATATDAASALAQARSQQPDLILSDVLMPGTDGFQLCLAVRRDPDLAGVPVVLLSAAYSDPEDRDLARRVGASALLPRLPDIEDLVPAILDQLDREDAPPAPVEPIERLRLDHADRVRRQLDRQVAFKAELAQQATLQAAQLSILNGVAEALTRSDGVEGQLGDVLAACLDAGGIDRCALYRNDGAGPPRLSHVVGFPEALRADLEGLLGSQHLLAKVIADGVALLIASPPLDPVAVEGFLGRAGVASAMIVPLTGGGRCAGALLLGASVASWERGQLAFGRAVGAYVGQALVLAETFAQERAARAAAEEASRAKDEFLAMLGHELRNPLAPMVTALHLLRLRGSPALGREHDIMERQVKHLARLVDDLLDVSRIASGKVELKRERIEVASALTDAVETVRPLIDQRAHHLEIQVPETGLAVYADPERLSQVLFNVLANAAKYTDVGGHIAVLASVEGGAVVVRIRDSGIGIAREMLPRVFDRFAQARQASDRSQGGLGLGLSIVHSLVSMHGGSVSADSDGPGRGTEMTIRLPAAASSAPSEGEVSSRPSEPLPAVAPGCRVLVVDDNQDAAEQLAELLETFGYTAAVAFDGPAALRLAEEMRPDVALLDIGLPGMDGYELGRRLRELPGLARLPLVAVTGYGQESDRQRSREAGFNVHMVKPVSLKHVEAVFTRLVESPRTVPA